MLRFPIKTKRGDGLSINVIVMAVIALVVLIVLIFMFTRGTGTLSKGVNACDGGCIFEGSSCATGYVKIPSNCMVGDQRGSFCCTNVDAITGQ